MSEKSIWDKFPNFWAIKSDKDFNRKLQDWRSEAEAEYKALQSDYRTVCKRFDDSKDKVREAQRKLDLFYELRPHLRIDCSMNPSWEFCSQCEKCELGKQVKEILECEIRDHVKRIMSSESWGLTPVD